MKKFEHVGGGGDRSSGVMACGRMYSEIECIMGKGLFTHTVIVSVTVKVYHCINGDEPHY